MRSFYLISANEYIRDKDARVVLIERKNDSCGADNRLTEIRWRLTSPPFDCIKKLKIKLIK